MHRNYSSGRIKNMEEEKEYDVPTFYYKYFYSADTGVLVGGVDRATIWRWVKKGKIKSVKDPQGYSLIELDEINRVRKERGLDPLDEEDIEYYWQWARLPAHLQP